MVSDKKQWYEFDVIDPVGKKNIIGFAKNLNFNTLPVKALIHVASNRDSILSYKKIIVYGIIKEIQPSNMHTGFNWSDYLYRRGIYYEFNPFSSEIKCTLTQKKKSSFEFARNYFNEIILSYIKTEKYAAIVSALVFGAKSDKMEEIENNFRKTGTIHILAISGMHIHLYFEFVIILFGYISCFKKYKIHYIVSLLIIWYYSFIAGLSPSVLRATFMITILVLSSLLKKKNQNWNSLFIAFTIQILLEPSILFNTGFLLSYSAVAGIMLFMPKYFEPTQRFNIVKHIKSLLLTSLAAQTLIAAQILIGSGIFAIYFLPANLIIIPLSTLIIYLGISLLILSPVYVIGKIIGSLITYVLEITLHINQFFSDLPFAYNENINLDSLFLFLFIIISLLLIFLIKLGMVQTIVALLTLNSIPFIETILYMNYPPSPGLLVLSDKSRTSILYNFYNRKIIYTNNFKRKEIQSREPDNIFSLEKLNNIKIIYKTSRITTMSFNSLPQKSDSTDYLVISDGCTLTPEIILKKIHVSEKILVTGKKNMHAWKTYCDYHKSVRICLLYNNSYQVP